MKGLLLFSHSLIILCLFLTLSMTCLPQFSLGIFNLPKMQIQDAYGSLKSSLILAPTGSYHRLTHPTILVCRKMQPYYSNCSLPPDSGAGG